MMINSLLGWMKELVILLVDAVSGMGYAGIVILMFLESSFFPFPSEIIMVPAGYLSSKGEMSLLLVILFGLAGSVLGALFNYMLGLKLGRPFLLKWGRYMLINERSLAKAEEKFNIHGEIITFIGRLIPGVRQYISFPPGLTGMNVNRFLIFTAAGAGIWVTVLSLLGYYIGNSEALIRSYLHEITYALLIFSIIVIAAYIYFYKRKTKRHARQGRSVRNKNI